MVGLSLGTYWDIFLILNLFKTKSEPRLLGINGKIKIQSCIIIKNSSNVVIFFFFPSRSLLFLRFYFTTKMRCVVS